MSRRIRTAHEARMLRLTAIRIVESRKIYAMVENALRTPGMSSSERFGFIRAWDLCVEILKRDDYWRRIKRERRVPGLEKGFTWH